MESFLITPEQFTTREKRTCYLCYANIGFRDSRQTRVRKESNLHKAVTLIRIENQNNMMENIIANEELILGGATEGACLVYLSHQETALRQVNVKNTSNATIFFSFHKSSSSNL